MVYDEDDKTLETDDLTYEDDKVAGDEYMEELAAEDDIQDFGETLKPDEELDEAAADDETGDAEEQHPVF